MFGLIVAQNSSVENAYRYRLNGRNRMKKIIFSITIFLIIIFVHSDITGAFFGAASPYKPVSGSMTLLLVGSGLIMIANWGRKKFR